jgi:linoleoyl-CoA desaturase
MKDIDKIYEMMKIYEIKKEDFTKFNITEEVIKSKTKLKIFNYDNYHKLSKAVKERLSDNHKVTEFWYLKVSILLSLYIFFYYEGLLNNKLSHTLKYIYSFTAGFFWVYVGFCTMHDASHYGLFNTKSKNIIFNNDVISSLWHGWALWNSFIWYKHHTYAHHSFTGIFGKDPDMIHGRPLFRKSSQDNKILKIFLKIQDKISLMILFFAPGMFVGQILAYFVGMLRGHIWRIGIKDAFEHTPIYEKILYLISLYVLIFNSSYGAVLMYLFGLNINYAICIVPDHDTFESTIENDKETNDWCEMEIRKSANFCEDSKIITEINGGINYQIEHHIFPTIAHCHYEKIAPIVKSFCIENNIPRVEKKSLMEVYLSYQKMLKHVKN